MHLHRWLPSLPVNFTRYLTTIQPNVNSNTIEGIH